MWRKVSIVLTVAAVGIGGCSPDDSPPPSHDSDRVDMSDAGGEAAPAPAIDASAAEDDANSHPEQTIDAATGDAATGDAATGDAATGDAATGDAATFPPPIGNGIVVTSGAELAAALAAATGGEVILLASGSYGALTIKGRAFSSFVTLAAQDGKRGATLGNIVIDDSSYVRLQGLHVAGKGAQAIFVDKGSHHVEILDCDVHGPKYDRSKPSYQQATMAYVIRLYGGSHHLRVEGNSVHDAKNGPTSFGVSHVVMKDNVCDWVASDCFKFGGVDELVFDGNVGARNIHSSPDAHVDFMQAQGPVTNAVYRNNVALLGTRSFQGLFFGGSAPHENIVVENNLIYNAHLRAISFIDASTNITVRNNTVLNAPGVGGSAAAIIGADVNEHNVSSHKLSKSGPAGTNLVLQHEDPKAPLHYSAVYANATAGAKATLADFTPVASGPAACGSGIGAEALLCP